MASFRKLKTGYRAELCVKGIRESAMFDTKAEAKTWAAMRETELRKGESKSDAGKTVASMFDRYAKEVTPGKRGARWERLRLNLFHRYPLAKVKLSELSAAHIAAWRDTRLTEVAPASVKRELVLIGAAMEVARREWGWLEKNPCKDVRKPTAPHGRDRRITDDEIFRICMALGYESGEATLTKHRVAIAFLFAIETAMRAGEICGLRPADIVGRVATLPMTKNGKARQVPLSSRALELIACLPESETTLFQLSGDSLSTQFRSARIRAGIENLTFHDSRHEAITRLADIFNPLELARIVGHSDLKTLMVYYNKSAAQLADKLA